MKSLLKIIYSLVNLTKKKFEIKIIKNEIETKKNFVYIVFDWVSKNLWFSMKDERFRHVMQNKIKYLKTDTRAKKITEDFGWLEFISPPKT